MRVTDTLANRKESRRQNITRWIDYGDLNSKSSALLQAIFAMLSNIKIALLCAELNSLVALSQSQAAEPLSLQFNLFNT